MSIKTLKRFGWLCAAGMLALAGCNTVSGIGQDLTDASNATRDAFNSGSDQPRTSSTNDGTKPDR